MNEGQKMQRLAAAGEESELSPEASLGLIDSESRRVLRSLQPDTAVILGAWGAAWLVGFGVMWLALSGRLVLPLWVAYATNGTLGVSATLVVFAQMVRGGRGVLGPSRHTASQYGWSWLLALGGVWLLDLALEHQGLPSQLDPLLWTGSTLLVVGLLYLGGGMLWGNRVLYGLGAWILLTGAGSVAVGVPGNFAVLSLAGGGGFLVAAGVARVRSRQSAPMRP